MPAFLLAYHGGAVADTDEARAASMESWNEWMDSISDALIDGGNPVGETKTLGADGELGDAPADPLTGYSIVDAEDLAEAAELARGCPILAQGGRIQIAELLDMGIDDDDADDFDEDDEE